MKYLILFLPILISSCATIPMDPIKAKFVPEKRIYKHLNKSATNTAKITVVRDSGLLSSGCAIGFYLDHELVADLNTSEKVEIYVPSGEHLVGAGSPSGGGWCGGYLENRETFLKEKQEKKFRIKTDSTTGVDIIPHPYQ
jgi:hypothetical protein